MYKGSFLETKSEAVLRAEKWARGIRKATCILAALIILIMFIAISSTVDENNKLTNIYLNAGVPLETIREEIPDESETVIEGIVVTAISVGIIMAIGYYSAMHLELRAEDVHNKMIIANCELYHIHNEKDENEDEI
ncbi:MAG: hypothetical protein J6M35_04875 [Clostridia bacterium]|nr:hypothetical protein [Clostridia bacterium]